MEDGDKPRLIERLRSIPVRTMLLPQGEIALRAVLPRLLFALILACILWVRVSADEDPVRQVAYDNVPITALTAPHYTLLTGLPRGTIHVQALQSTLRDAPAPKLYVDLTGITSMTPLTVPVQVSNIPQGAREQHSPQFVKVQLQTEVTRTFTVVTAPSTYGQPPPGFNIPNISSVPPTVTVSGPSGIVDQVRTVRVASINIGDYTQNTTLTRTPQLFDRAGNSLNSSVVKIKPSQVKIVIEVQPQPHQQLVPVTVKLKGAVAPGYSITNITVFPQVVQAVSNSLLANAAVTATVPISGLKSSHTFPTVLLTGPPGATLNRTEATVTVDVRPIPGSATSVAGVRVVGQRPGTAVAVAPSKVTITYGGLLPDLRDAKAPVAILDVGNRKPGTYTLTPTIKLSSGLKLIAVTPSTLRVTITAAPQPRVAARTPTPTPKPTATRR